MFDPTIYDNLKVVLEGAVYEYDLKGQIQIADRKDVIDIAVMSRTYSIYFQQAGAEEGAPLAGLTLHAPIADLAAELLERDGVTPGCELHVTFELDVPEPEIACPIIENRLKHLWENRPQISQRVSYLHGGNKGYNILVTLEFNRKIDESNIEDVSAVLSYMCLSLEWFTDWKGQLPR
ncbi:hypothetical protein ABNC64_13640 [Paenibacillus larvae]